MKNKTGLEKFICELEEGRVYDPQGRFKGMGFVQAAIMRGKELIAEEQAQEPVAEPLAKLAELADRKGWGICSWWNIPCDNNTKMWEIGLRSLNGTSSYPGKIGTAKYETFTKLTNVAAEAAARKYLNSLPDRKEQ